MNIALDSKGTVAAYPKEFGELMQALKAAGNTVTILTGVEQDEVGPEDAATERSFLNELGITPAMYDNLIVVPRPHPKNKVAMMRKEGIDTIIDNKAKTAKKATKAGFLALVPWGTREK